MTISEEVKKDVVDTLYWDDRIDVSKVNVEAQESRVTLSGTGFHLRIPAGRP